MPRRDREPTEAQKKSRQRSWKIFRLRGLHAQAHMLTEPWRIIALRAIDMELLSMGAEAETDRQNAIKEKYL